MKDMNMPVKDFLILFWLPNRASVATYQGVKSTPGPGTASVPSHLCKPNFAASMRIFARLIFLYQFYAGKFALFFGRCDMPEM